MFKSDKLNLISRIEETKMDSGLVVLQTHRSNLVPILFTSKLLITIYLFYFSS